MQEIKGFFIQLFLIGTIPKLRGNQKGMTLAEIVAASAVTSIIAVGSAALIAQSKNIANNGEFQTNLDTRHTLNVQKLRNLDAFLSAVGLYGIANTSSANNCFKKKGTNCNLPYGDGGFSVPGTGLIVPPLYPLSNDVINGITSDGLISMSVTYNIDCEPTRCSRIRIHVKTQPSSAAMNAGLTGKVRSSDITIPTSFLTDKKSVDFTCSTSGKILTGVDYGDLSGVCNNYSATAVACAGGTVPPNSYGTSTPGCYSSASTGTCANGVKSMGPYAGQQACN